MAAIGRFLGVPYGWVDHDFGYWVVQKLYGGNDAGIENIENIFFFISFIFLIVITTILYALIVRIIQRFR